MQNNPWAVLWSVKKTKTVTIKHPKRMTTKITQDNKQPKQKIMQPNTLKSKNNGCGTAPGNLVSNKSLTSL